MSRHRLLAAFTPQDAPLPIFPQPPKLSSHRAAWNNIYLEHHQQPAYETPEYRYGWYIISIHLGSPIVVEKWVEGKTFQCKSVLEGQIGVYPAQLSYRERCLNATEFIDLYLAPDLLRQAAADLLPANEIEICPYFAQPDPLIHQMGLALKAELEQSGERLYAESMATALAVHLLRRYSQTQPLLVTGKLTVLQLNQIADYIHDHLADELSVLALAQMLQLSPYHFSRLFKQTTGLSPHQYILQCRVERAKQLLRQGRLSLADVALSVGFASQSHLNRHFKRFVGLTPRQFRRA